MTDAEAHALDRLPSFGLRYVTSPVTTTEVRRIRNARKAAALKFVAHLMEQLPRRPSSGGGFGSAPFGEAPFGGAAATDPTLLQLNGVFDSADAEHVHYAVRSGCDYFLTLDRKTILDRVPANRDKLARLCGNLRFVAPSDLVAEMEAKGQARDEPITERLPVERERLIERYHEALRDGEVVPDPVFGYVACPKCRLPSEQLGGSHSTDYEYDREYVSICCPRCGWSDWTEV